MLDDDLYKKAEQYMLENQDKHYRLAYHYVKNPEDALDVVQEAICKALGSWGKVKSPTHFKTWFYRILIHTAMDLLRRRKRLTAWKVDAKERLNHGKPDVYADPDLQMALEDLPAHARNVVVLKYFEDLTFDEIAHVLGMNVNTVKTRLYRALELLRRKMDA